MKLSPNAPCPCGRGLKYKQCCRPLHRGRTALTAEALMRSRYTAYTIGDINYIIETTHPDGPLYRSNRADWLKELTFFSQHTQFVRLDILEATDEDDLGQTWVTFRAILTQGDHDASFTERSLFKRHHNMWKYFSGEHLDDMAES
ncbi:YchJ family metal-binding protein [Anaerolineales bacterium HSG6]|nr:YchJ family metal-binding protein [Anaerolineales bacterium HSG6]MDM8530287.1 YchJ family metal-binding protein [Anaerolineales bacterium HSG25]